MARAILYDELIIPYGYANFFDNESAFIERKSIRSGLLVKFSDASKRESILLIIPTFFEDAISLLVSPLP
jgi:hypothetical protein